jgi:hypothetical protein
VATTPIEQAGAKPISWVQLACELQRDWNREETVAAFSRIFIETGGTMGLQVANDQDTGV